jgi:hypothetical protein
VSFVQAILSYIYILIVQLNSLLALFGEQFARQFMSESLTWLDHIVFAMVPLGIITAIVGAIRVAGPPWARAFIGRAREGRAAAEIDFMSSTSKEVCEVYNGKSVVRAMGKPKLTQLIFIADGHGNEDITCGLHTLETAYREKLLERDKLSTEDKGRNVNQNPQPTSGNRNSGTFRRRNRRTRPNSGDMENGLTPAPTDRGEHSDEQVLLPKEITGSAPNLQLNLPDTVLSPSSNIQELYWAATIAVAVQVAVVTTGAITSYHSPTRKWIGGETSKYGFPLFVSGTICLNAGMLLCSWVIEKSTKEHIWRKAKPFSGEDSQNGQSNSPDVESTVKKSKKVETLKLQNEKDDKSQLQVFWLQQKHIVNDQVYEPYLIFGGIKREILTSSRIEHKATFRFIKFAANKYELVTVCATLLGLVGFILQFEGLRGLTWATAVAQLVSIIAMALIRAFIRRRLSERVSTVKVLEGPELDWLAMRLVYDDYPLKPPSTESESLQPSSDLGSTGALPSAGSQSASSSYPASTLSSREDLISRMTFRVLTKLDQPTTRLLVEHGCMVPKADLSAHNNTGAHPTTLQEDQQEGYSKQLYPRESQVLIKVRQRLGELTECPGVVSNEAIALSHVMSFILNTLCSNNDFADKTFRWTLPVKTQYGIKLSLESSEASEKMEKIVLRAERDEIGWFTRSSDVDAVLTMWMSSYAEPTTRLQQEISERASDWLMKKSRVIVSYRRILGELIDPPGPVPDGELPKRTNRLTRDLTWWLNDARICDEIETFDVNTPGPGWVIGFDGMDDEGQCGLKCMTSSTSLHFQADSV